MFMQVSRDITWWLVGMVIEANLNCRSEETKNIKTRFVVNLIHFWICTLCACAAANWTSHYLLSLGNNLLWLILQCVWKTIIVVGRSKLYWRALPTITMIPRIVIPYKRPSWYFFEGFGLKAGSGYAHPQWPLLHYPLRIAPHVSPRIDTQTI
jgi:hypothetical protein